MSKISITTKRINTELAVEKELIRKFQKNFTDVVYISSKLVGDKIENEKKVNRLIKVALANNKVPLSTLRLYKDIYDINNSLNRTNIKNAGLRLIDVCSEVWIDKNNMSSITDEEINYANKQNKKVVYF